MQKCEKAIKAIITGHTHENYDGADCGKRQIVTGALNDGFAREIVIM